MKQRLMPYPKLGDNAPLQGFRPFPPQDPWNTQIDRAPVDPNSKNFLEAVLARHSKAHLHPDFGADWGIPYVVVGQETSLSPIRFTDYGDESDPGPYPVPRNAPIEGGNIASNDGDRHVIVVDRDRAKLYELSRAFPEGNGSWKAGSGAIFDLRTNTQRPAGWTSADAAGLPIFPGLVRYDEVMAGEIQHAIRFTIKRSRRAYVPPASHFASKLTDDYLMPMGARVRLKGSVSLEGLGPQARVIAKALQTYGMILADNGSDFFVSGAPHSKWDDSDLNRLKRFLLSDFEVVKLGPLTTK